MTENKNTRSNRKEKIGVVSSNKMHKTITVVVERQFMHPKYRKFMLRTSKFKAHDEKGEAKIGDTVLIFEVPPMSKTKRWKLGKILERGTIENLEQSV